MIEAAGARMLFLPPYSLDFNPIEQAFSKLKVLLRKAAERAVTGLWDRIGKMIDLVEPQEACNFFTSCGYDPIGRGNALKAEWPGRNPPAIIDAAGWRHRSADGKL
jgi:hypothetical protein